MSSAPQLPLEPAGKTAHRESVGETAMSVPRHLRYTWDHAWLTPDAYAAHCAHTQGDRR
ncbi:hypothetical protein [Streptomyces sp. NPDC014995]|uniref:hypothetical protein n=1 Tax=Streptomyces sp. NPDC014995 TaxID=3364936 RepID=UPI0037034D27